VAGTLPSRARVVVVGGGVVGCAVAYHLTRRGWTDVVVLERKTLTSGTTWHAAGLVTQARGTSGLRRIVKESLTVFADLQAQTGIGFQRTGTVHLAATVDRWEEIRRQAAAASADGIISESLAPEEIPKLFPLLDPAGLVGGIHYPDDGRGNATDTTLAMAGAARRAGAAIVENVEVTEVLVADGRARGVRTGVGEIEAEYVVNATGMWGRAFGAGHGAPLALQALEHYYLVTEQVPGLGSGWPTLKSSDDCAYVKDDAGKMLVGFFEPGSRPWSPDGIPADTEFATAAGDWDHIAPYYEKIAARIPVLADLGVRLFFCGPESFTPDGVYHLGPVPGIGNYLAAVGFNSVGFLSGPGAGKVVADWLIDGRPPFALIEADPRRVQPFQVNRRYLQERVTETLDLSYGIHWPFEQRTSARGLRRSPVHDRVAAAGAVFGEVAGWERANWYARDGVEAAYSYSFGEPSWAACAAAEHLAVRSALGLFDISSFGKLLVAGPGAQQLLQRVSAGDVEVPVGRIVYTQWLNEVGGIEADVTVTRTGPAEFLVLTAALSTVRDADWLRRSMRAGEFATITDVSNSWALFALMGPRARRFLQPLTDADLSHDVFGFGASREIDLGQVFVRATRITYVGELGWELLVPTESAVHVYQTLIAAAYDGPEPTMVHAGYHALNSLRLEKGYRSWGHDIGPDDTALEAGLGFAVAWDKEEFTGRDALVRQRSEGIRRRLVQLHIPGPGPMVFHDEPVYRDGVLAGTVTSAALAPTVGGTVALAYIGGGPDGGVEVTDEWVLAGQYQVDVAGLRVPAVVSLRPLYDPSSARPRSAD